MVRFAQSRGADRVSKDPCLPSPLFFPNFAAQTSHLAVWWGPCVLHQGPRPPSGGSHGPSAIQTLCFSPSLSMQVVSAIPNPTWQKHKGALGSDRVGAKCGGEGGEWELQRGRLHGHRLSETALSFRPPAPRALQGLPLLVKCPRTGAVPWSAHRVGMRWC